MLTEGWGLTTHQTDQGTEDLVPTLRVLPLEREEAIPRLTSRDDLRKQTGLRQSMRAGKGVI